MKNVILSMLAKISKIDADNKKLSAQVEAQSLLLSALILTVGKNGGVNEMVESVNKAINSVLDASDDTMKSDAQLLLTEFHELLNVTRLVEKADSQVDSDALSLTPNARSALSDDKS